MATGRHRGYRDYEFRDREADFGLSKKERGYSEGDYDRISKLGRETGRGRNGGLEEIGYRNKVQNELKGREVVNGAYLSALSQVDSGTGGVTRRCSMKLNSKDREPGELSSDGSDGAIGSEIYREPERMLDNGNQSTPPEGRKRKFSPIVWDRDDKAVSKVANVKNAVETVSVPSKSPSDDATTLLPSDPREVHASEASPSKVDYPPDLHEDQKVTSSLVPENEPGVEMIYDDDDIPARTITSSRWANDADSPADEGEIYDYGDSRRVKNKSSSESDEFRTSISPELDEIKREGSEGIKGRYTGSDDCPRSSSRDSYHGVDHMESDERNYDSDADDDHSHSTPEPLNTPQRSFNMLQGCRNVDEFQKLNEIDEGTYGVVYRAKDKKTGEIVALKKVKMKNEQEGFPLTALREINILLSFHHPSIIDVKEVVMSNQDQIFMVMEYMEHDLKGLMEAMKHPFSQSEVKCLMFQLLEGIKYLHDNWILHRDLKTSNLLLNNRGELKICDFGLARQYGSPLKPYTHLVVTLWYRAPELLLGAKEYSTAIDMWSVGCIMAELLSKEPLFNGKTEVEQLDKIFKILGTPNVEIWPGLSELPGAKVKFVKHKYNMLRKKFPGTSFTGSPLLSAAGFDLLSKLLTYDPEKRITVEEALKHDWFREVPLPKSKEFMPTFPAQHAQDRRMRRILKSPDPLQEQRRKELQGELGNKGLFFQ